MISAEQLERWKEWTEARAALLDMIGEGPSGDVLYLVAIPALIAEVEAQAKEIGRLREDQCDWRKGVELIRTPLVRFAGKNLPTLSCTDIAEAVVQVCAEIERLRAALRQASDDICRGVSDDVCRVVHPTAHDRWCASCIARAALKEGT